MWCEILLQGFISFALASIDAKDPELPLCPTNMQYFPQNLPMHCRLPGTMPPFSPPVYQNPEIGKQPMPVPLPGMPGPIPGMMPGPMPMSMVPMPQAPAHKLPVIVMPFYSPDTSAKKPQISHQVRPRKRKHPKWKRRPQYYTSDEDSTDSSTETDDSTDTSSERGFWRDSRVARRSNSHHKSKRKKHQENKEVLTPILQYVTKDGYVIFEKQISKGEAKDWLVAKDNNNNEIESSLKKEEDAEYSLREGDKKDQSKILIKDAEEIEIKTELNPHQMHNKKNLKRKPLRKKAKA